MSTEIKDTISGSAELWVETAGTRRIVVFGGSEGGVRTLNTMEQPDFLAAVENELDVLVIDKADLPEVLAEDGSFAAYAPGIAEIKSVNVNTTNLRNRAYALLAIAEYADANPTVDQKQVEALTDALDEAFAATEWSKNNADLARALVATGRVTVSD